MTVTIAWWMIPALITVLCIGYAAIHDDGDGYLSGLGNLILMVPALALSLVAWIIGAILN